MNVEKSEGFREKKLEPEFCFFCGEGILPGQASSPEWVRQNNGTMKEVQLHNKCLFENEDEIKRKLAA